MKEFSFFTEKEYNINCDYRVNKRHKYDSTLRVESINSNKVDIEFKGIDISISGIGFISDTSFRIGDVLEIVFKYNKVTIPTIVTVRHTNLYDKGFYIGTQFLALPNMYRAILEDLE